MNFEIANTTVLLWDMFYLGNPHRHMYKDIKHLPHIYAQVNWIYKNHETQYDISVRRLNCTLNQLERRGGIRGYQQKYM